MTDRALLAGTSSRPRPGYDGWLPTFGPEALDFLDIGVIADLLLDDGRVARAVWTWMWPDDKDPVQVWWPLDGTRPLGSLEVTAWRRVRQ
ncbi:MAG TPA: hypothetical protein VH913_14120 [Hyphomicrobiaceae bacterium]|jgi:hypothetical protein